MKSLTRRFVVVLAAVIAIGAVAPVAAQGTYPTKPVRLVVPFPAGGTPDAFVTHIAAESAKWAKVVKASGAHVD